MNDETEELCNRLEAQMDALSNITGPQKEFAYKAELFRQHGDVPYWFELEKEDKYGMAHWTIYQSVEELCDEIASCAIEHEVDELLGRIRKMDTSEQERVVSIAMYCYRTKKTVWQHAQELLDQNDLITLDWVYARSILIESVAKRAPMYLIRLFRLSTVVSEESFKAALR